MTFDDAHQKAHEDMLERSIWLNSRCDALSAVLVLVSGDSKDKKMEIAALLEKATNQFYSERLKKIEDSDPALASRLNRFGTHKEGLSDDANFLTWE